VGGLVAVDSVTGPVYEELNSGVGSCSARVVKKRLLHRAKLSRSAGPKNRSTSAAAAFQSMAAIFAVSLSITHLKGGHLEEGTAPQ
jgi:hypothetical protein